jgi:hypothetical protein
MRFALGCQERQAKPEGGSLPGSALHPDGATVSVDDLLTDVEPEPQAHFAAGVGLHTRYPMKPFPEMLLLRRRDTWPFVLDQDESVPGALNTWHARRTIHPLGGLV